MSSGNISQFASPNRPDHTAERAMFWSVSVRVMQIWKKRRLPVDDIKEMVRWYSGLSAASQRKLTPEFRRRLLEERIKLEGAAGVPVAVDPDYEQFANSYKAAQSEDRDTMGALKRQRAFYLFKLEQAQKRNDYSAANEATKQLAYFADVIHDAEIRAKRLGVDIGETLAKAEVERMFFAWAFWALRSVDQHLDALTAQLEKLAPGLPKEQARRVLERELLSARFLVPFAQAAGQQSGVALPGWAVEKMRKTCGDFLANGEALFEQEREKVL